MKLINNHRGEIMAFMYALVVIIILAAIVLTLRAAGKIEEDYGKKTKRNAKNLSMIYGVIILLSVVALGVYISFVY